MSATLYQLNSYPKQPGDQPWSIIDLRGPAAYQIFVPGTGGGQTITAADFGLQSLDFVEIQASNTGAYHVEVVPNNFTVNGPFSSAQVIWLNVNSAGQAPAMANLTAQVVRLLAIGR